MIHLVPYDPEWPRCFAAEAQRIRARFGEQATRIDHVGSTSVPGLMAKPVINIQISVPSLLPHGRFNETLLNLGYRHLDQGDFSRVYPFFHRPSTLPHSHHIHLCEAGGEQERRHLAFRDYLCRHPQSAQEYQELKCALAGQYAGHTDDEQERYSLAKGPFIEQIIERAYAEGLPAYRP